MMDATQYPDIMTMTIPEAKAWILKAAKRPVSDPHDVEIDGLARELSQAADQLERASSMAKGGRVTHYGGGQSPAAAKTRVLYDAAWELVLEGILRPGIKHFGALNPRDGGFCLTPKGREALGLPL